MRPANQEAMFIQDTKATIVQWAHDLRPLTMKECLVTPLQPCPTTTKKRILHPNIESPETYPEKGPFGIGMMKKIRITTIVRTSSTGKPQGSSNLIVFRLKFLVNLLKFAYESGRQ